MANDDTIKKTISQNITYYRKKAGLSQKEFAAKLGAAPSRVSSWETGANSTDIDTLFEICSILDVSINDMCGVYPDSNLSLSYPEQEHIKKYRNLDNRGRKIVDSVLSHESDRVKALEDQARKILELQRAIIPHYIMAYYEKMASAGSGEYLFDDIPTDLIEVPDCPMAHKADFVIGVTGRSMEPTYCDGDKVYVKKMAEIPTGSIGIFVRGNECFIKELGVDRLISHNKDCPDIPASDDIQLVGKVLGKVEEA